MEAFAVVLMVFVGVIAFQANDWIKTYWNGKKEVEHEKRLAAEANDRAAQANVEAIRLQDRSRHNS